MDEAGENFSVGAVAVRERFRCAEGAAAHFLVKPAHDWLAARPEAPDLADAGVREALERLDPLWDELFPAEQARIVRLLVERVEVGPAGANIRLRVAGLASLVRDLGVPGPGALEAAA